MKRTIVTITAFLLVCAFAAGGLFAQEKKQEEKKVSQQFLTTWKKVGNKTKEIKSFKTEKATTVAGVRGAEAEDEALKFLYFKGGVRYPSRLELKNAIDILEAFVQNNPDDETVPESMFFIGQCHQQLGQIDQAKTAYENLIEKHPDSDYKGMAEKALEALKKG